MDVDTQRSSDVRSLPALPISSRLTSNTTEPSSSSQPRRLAAGRTTRHGPLYAFADFEQNKRILPPRYLLHDLRNARESNPRKRYLDVTHKVLTLSEFLAISLVRQPSIDVVAVSIDQVSTETIKVTIARNESTPEDVNQANTLRKLFMDHFINNRSEKRHFKQEYLRTISTWGSLRYERRLTVLNHPESTQKGPKSAARASKLLTIEKVMSEFTKISTDGEKIQQVKSIRSRYTHCTIR